MDWGSFSWTWALRGFLEDGHRGELWTGGDSGFRRFRMCLPLDWGRSGAFAEFARGHMYWTGGTLPKSALWTGGDLGLGEETICHPMCHSMDWGRQGAFSLGPFFTSHRFGLGEILPLGPVL
jgi:hypothetical protein